MVEELALWDSEMKIARGEIDHIGWWEHNHMNYKVLPRVVGNVFGKPVGAHSCEKNWSKTGRICEPRRNALDPVRVSKLILISETVLQFGGIRYENKPPVDNIFLRMHVAKKNAEEVAVYDNAQHNVVQTSDSSSEDEPVFDQPIAQTQAQRSRETDVLPQEQSDSEEESEDLLAARRK